MRNLLIVLAVFGPPAALMFLLNIWFWYRRDKQDVPPHERIPGDW